MEVGIFKRLGLECTFPRLETGGPEAVAGVVRSDWEFAETGSAPYVQAALDGRDIVILLAALAPLSTGLPILTRPPISDLNQLDGKRLGVLTDTGSPSPFAPPCTRGVSAPPSFPLGRSAQSMRRSSPETLTPSRSQPTIASWDRESSACESLTHRALDTYPSLSDAHVASSQRTAASSPVWCRATLRRFICSERSVRRSFLCSNSSSCSRIGLRGSPPCYY